MIDRVGLKEFARLVGHHAVVSACPLLDLSISSNHWCEDEIRLLALMYIATQNHRRIRVSAGVFEPLPH